MPDHEIWRETRIRPFMSFNSRCFRALALSTSLFMSYPAVAQAADEEPEAADASKEIVVYGRGEKLIDTAVQASQGVVTGVDLRVRPLSRVGEILEAVPGLIATQHSGGGKANQYFLRGFNLDHGTDITFYIDDVPMNLRTNAHGQGYLDINALIPETVSRIEYRKGPYRADVGDFALAAAAQATTVDTLDPYISIEGGSYGYRRVGVGGSAKIGGGDLVLAGQIKYNDGKWELAEQLRSYSGYAKYSTETGMGKFSLSASLYDAQWRPTEQVPERAIGTLISSPYGTLDPDLTGKTSRQIISAQLNGDDWRASLYFQNYKFSLVSNFTFFLDDPVNGDEIEQAEQRQVYGGRLEKRFKVSDTLSLLTGFEGRFDDIGNVGLYSAIGGVRSGIKNQFRVKEASGGLYAELDWKPTDQLTINAGLRGEAYSFKTRGTGGADWNGSVNDTILLPKIGGSYRIADGVALYANYGEGFHSNDARGVTNPVDPAPGLVRGRGGELGLRVERGSLIATATLFQIDVASELVYVGDAGTVEPGPASTRRGYELTAFWRPTSWLALDGVFTGARPRFKNSPGADRIPGALEHVGEVGASAVTDRWNAGLRLRYLGKGALIEDNSVRSRSTTLVNLRAAYTPGRYELFAELLNLFDSRRKDIEYFYATRLLGEPVGGIEGRNSRVVEPFTVRVGGKISF